MIVNLKLKGNQIAILFSYDKDIIARIQEIKDRRFSPVEKYWTIPLTSLEEAKQKLFEFDLFVDPAIYEALSVMKEEEQGLDPALKKQSPFYLVPSAKLPRNGYICLNQEGNAILIKAIWKDGLYDKLTEGYQCQYKNGFIVPKPDAITLAFDILAEGYKNYACTQKAFQFYLTCRKQEEKEWVRNDGVVEIVESDQNVSDLVIPDNIKGKPYPFQLKGIEFMLKAGSGLITDEVGLGKTIQAICYAECIESKRTLVVCPATLKLNWKKEIEDWTDKKAWILADGEGFSIFKKLNPEYVITNYEALIDRGDSKSKYMFFILNQEWDLIIVDEIHKVKSLKAKQTKALHSIKSLFKYHLGLTGTPLLNRPIELFSPLNFVAPDKVNHYFRFAKEFCGAKKGHWGWDFTGSSNIDKLKELIAPVMIRRKKEEVLKDLPDKTIQEVPVGLNGLEKEYRFAEDEFISWLKGRYGNEKAMKASRAEQLAKIGYLKQICSNAKIDTVLELIENANGNKVVVFSQFKDPLKKLKSKLGDKAVLFTGDVNEKDRNKMVEDFQNDPETTVFLGTIKAGGLGITLTAASMVLIMDLPWTPADLDQAEGRLHRIGQKNAVLACRLICRDTIEESILALLNRKKAVIGKVLGEEVEATQESMLSSLIDQLVNRR